MPSSHRLLKIGRLIHLYLGMFIAPMLLFFSFTGFVQTFSLHETLKGREYTPPAILVKLGQFHKKQTFVVPASKLAPPAAAPKPGLTQMADRTKAPAVPEALVKKQNLWPMKIFFGLVAVGLLTSTLTGIYMSYKYSRNRLAAMGLFVAGIVVPVSLTLF